MKNRKQLDAENNASDFKSIDMFALMKNGFSFEFKDSGHEITCWGSSATGKEIVYLNGKQVSEKRNLLSRKSLHKFIHKGLTYEVEFNMVSILKSELHCILIRDGVHVETQKARPTNFTNKKPFSLVRSVIEGFIFGFVGFGIGFYLANKFKSDGEVTSLILDSINMFLV